MRALVVHAHPDPDSFSRALRSAVERGLAAAGHDVDVIDLYAEDFVAAMTEEERRAYSGDSPIRSDHVARHAELVKRAEALVFVYPTWWWGMPAIMKGWLDRVLVPGVAFTLGEGRRPTPGLRHVRRLVGVSTYGASRLEMRFFNDSGRRTIARTIRMLTRRRARTTWLAMYRLDQASERERRSFLDTVEAKMAAL